MGRSQRDETETLNTSIIIENSSELVQSNGSSTVTISNVAPAGVGTATITKWLKVKQAGVDYFIPMWT